MNIDNSFPAAQLAIQRGVATARTAALEVARHQSADKQANIHDMARSMVQLKKAEHGVAAGIAIIKTTDDVLGSLLDVMA